jgi:hypothetical protein
MLRNLRLVALAACAMSAGGGLHADELSKAAPQARPAEDLYMLCAFYPKQGTCEPVYQRALKDNSISAEAVRAEYTGYARYLKGSSPLTDADRQYLKETGIRVPNDLSAPNQAGLHNVINDPELSADARRAAVNNFLSRAVEAELYCGFNSCQETTTREAAAGV